jgi:MinD-like ATPase involved in chromosome partitioning or flagellar assembly
MQKKAYVIRVSSQKGGVGKTTIAVNLATALRLLNYRVLLVDADHTNPSVGFHLGFDQVNQGFMDVINGKVSAKNAIITHAPTGLHVLPGKIGASVKLPTANKLKNMFTALAKEDYDFLIIDTAPGFLPQSADYLKNYDEAIIITTPEMSACTSAIRLAHNYDKGGVKHSLIVNRVRNKGYEVSMQEIGESYEGTVSGEIPEDDIVPLSISERIPAYIVNQRSKFANGVSKASKRYAAKAGSNYTSIETRSILDIILSFLGIRKRNRIVESLKE